jgi:predicted transposase YdaD
MSLIHEYGENKYNDGKDDGIEQGIEQIIENLLKSGEDAESIAEKANVPLEKVLEIKEKNKL